MLHFDYEDFAQTHQYDPYTTDAGDVGAYKNANRNNFFIIYQEHNHNAGIHSSPGEGHCGYNHLVFRQENFVSSQQSFAPELQTPAGFCTDETFWESPNLTQRPELSHLHAPVPLPGCASILRTHSYQSEEIKVANSDSNSSLPMVPQYQPGYQVYACPPLQRSEYGQLPSPQSNSTLQSTFLTPSELLVELSNQENQHPSKISHGRVGALKKPPRSCDSSTPTAPVVGPSFLPPSANDNSTESITSHEKKRHYLECLEHYVAFLHEHCRRNGLEPAPLERISSYRCLNSRSIRVSVAQWRCIRHPC